MLNLHTQPCIGGSVKTTISTDFAKALAQLRSAVLAESDRNPHLTNADRRDLSDLIGASGRLLHLEPRPEANR